MATLNFVDLGNNTRWVNEFEGAAVDREVKYTEDGRQFIFQKPKQIFRKLVLDCTGEWLPYDTVKKLADIRDSGQAAVLVHNDNRVFNVLLESIEGAPLKDFNKHSADSKFKLILHLMEI